MLLTDVVLASMAFLTLLLLLTALGSLWVWVPYVPTPMKVVRRMVELAKLQGQEIVYDLGCGDGRILIEVKRRYPTIRAIGYELPPAIYLLAKFRVWLAGLARRSLPGGPIEVRLRDFRSVDLRDADVLFLYLVPEVFARLERKLNRELRVGTRVISHGFPFPGKTPIHVERCPLPSWHLIRTHEVGPRIFVYQW